MRSTQFVGITLVFLILGGCSKASNPGVQAKGGANSNQVRAEDAPLRLGKFLTEDSALGVCEIELSDYKVQDRTASFALKVTDGCYGMVNVQRSNESIRYSFQRTDGKHHIWTGGSAYGLPFQIDIQDEDHLLFVRPRESSFVGIGTYFYRPGKTQAVGEEPDAGYVNLCRYGRIASAVAFSLGDISCSNISREKIASAKELSLTDLNLEEIPSGILNQFTGIESLNLSTNHIKKIDAQALQGLLNLKKVDFGTNQISEIPPGLFTGLKNLKEVSFYGNLLTEIKHGVLPNGYLTNLELNFNSIRSIEDGAFSEVSVSKLVRLNNNKLSRLSAGMLKGLRDVDSLNLSNNLITQIDQKAGEDLLLVRELDLGNNLLTVIPAGQFKFFAFRALNLENNQISMIEDSGLQRNPGAAPGTWLRLGGNPIKRIDKWKSGAGSYEIISGIEAD